MKSIQTAGIEFNAGHQADFLPPGLNIGHVFI
jgi:hypothetical protein